MTGDPGGLSLEHIEEASRIIDPTFLHTPQFVHDPIGRRLGFEVVLKVECANPIRSFKGRGTDYFTQRREKAALRPWVTASAGNFGQGLAYAAGRRGVPVIVFAAETANPFKLERMRALGADVRLVGADFDASKEAARAFAGENGYTFVEDGREPEISEGAGTIAVELLARPPSFDVLLVPVGNGALVNGVGTWAKAHAPLTRIVGVGVTRAPAMERSFRERRPVSLPGPVETIADGVGARVAVPEAVEILTRVVDDMILVDESAVLDAMRRLFQETGLVVEGAGAVPLAAGSAHRRRFEGQRVGMIVCGGNLTEEQVRRYLI